MLQVVIEMIEIERAMSLTYNTFYNIERMKKEMYTLEVKSMIIMENTMMKHVLEKR